MMMTTMNFMRPSILALDIVAVPAFAVWGQQGVQSRKWGQT